MYSEKVMDHFENPRNVGKLEDANAVGEVGNATCGDIMKIYMKIENGIIEDVSFKTFGCGAAIATSSMATELVKGKSVEEALQLTNKAVMEAQQAIHAALKDYSEKTGIDLGLPESVHEFDCASFHKSMHEGSKKD